MMFGFVICLVGVVKIIKGGKDNFIDIKGGVHEAYSATFVKWLGD